ncbi:hypothetical protein MMC27_002915 [Xylographa pallens]|nr:hypothetical protein [Xylographa pallens]
MNETAPSHVSTLFVPEAFHHRENLLAASNTITHFPPDSYPQGRSVQEIFHRLGHADPIPDIPSLSSPSSMTFGSTWTSPAMSSSVQHVAGQDAGQNTGQDAGQDAGRNAGQDAGRAAGLDAGLNAEEDAVYTRNLANFRGGRGRNMPSGRLTCRSWFTKGECDKPPGHCQHTHMYMDGQGISPSQSIENDGQPIEKEILCRTDFLAPVPNVRHYEAHSPELEDLESPSVGQLVVGPRSFSQPYEMRAKIYSIVALSNRLQSMVQNPQTPVLYGSGTRRNAAPSPLTIDLNKARGLIVELYEGFQTYHTVIEQIQPRLLDFAEPLRTAAHAMNLTYRELSLLELLKMVADKINVIIGRHRVTESLKR